LQKDVAAFLQATDLKIEEWVASLVRYSFTPNGSSGTKLISHLFLDVLADIQNDQERMQKLEAFFKGKKVIYIKRMNRIRQAISLVKAKKSGVWHIKDKRLIKSEASSADLDITSPLISETINWITTQEKGMELFFEEFHLKPLVVYYEELEGQSSRQAVLDNIFRFLEVEVPHLESKTAYKPMADEESDQLFQAFVSDFYNSIRQGIGHFDASAEIILESLVAELKHREPDRHMKHGPLQHLLKKWKLSR
jgi:LPS sulfotransferase NodH